MSPMTMSEKEVFLAAFEREAQTTLRVLKGYPAAGSELRPAEKLRTARELAWMMVMNQMVLEPILDGTLQPGMLPEAPGTMAAVIESFEKAHRDLVAKLKATPEDRWNESLPMPVGPKQVADVRKGDALWMMHYDSIHHRGQFTVYTRMAGAKLGSIYGPTADEPWW